MFVRKSGGEGEKGEKEKEKRNLLSLSPFFVMRSRKHDLFSYVSSDIDCHRLQEFRKSPTVLPLVSALISSQNFDRSVNF